jgi:hypothetical protein
MNPIHPNSPTTRKEARFSLNTFNADSSVFELISDLSALNPIENPLGFNLTFDGGPSRGMFS